VLISPSPEPIYSHDGKRLNTREVRTRKKLEDQRHDLILEATKLNPEYRPPTDYKAPNRKIEDKVFIPQEHHPETNFVGLLIGPRGNTLKQLERESNTKIMIRGKGATKEGKFGRFGLPQPGEDEELHALITGSSPEVVKLAVDKIKAIIQSGIDVPGNENEIKKMQLMQLAELNGTFKPIDVLRCNNCGSSEHRTWQCSEQMNITSSIICTRCGGGGHIAQDCKVNMSAAPPPTAEKAKMDSEYLSLMKELGEKIPDHMQAAAAGDKAGVGVGTRVPPPPALMGGHNPGGLLVPDPHFHPAPPQPGGPWMFHPPHPGHFMHPGGPHMMMHPVPWGMHPVGPDGMPLMQGPIGPPPPPPPGS
jgi:splicing factor 1